MNYDDLQLINNEAIHNFELFVEGERAFIDYKLKRDKIWLIHTEVPKALEGRGIAGALVGKVLQYIEDHHLRMVPLCEYVQFYLKRHPEWNRVVAE